MAGTLLGTLAPSYLKLVGRPTVYIGGDNDAWTDSKTKIIIPNTFAGQPVEGDIALGLVAHEIGHWFQDFTARQDWLRGRPDFARPASNVLLDVALETAMTKRIPSIRFALEAVSAACATKVASELETAPAHPFNDLLAARFAEWPGKSSDTQAGKLIALAKKYGKRKLNNGKVMVEFLNAAAEIAPELFETPPPPPEKPTAPEEAEDASDNKDGKREDGETEAKPGDSGEKQDETKKHDKNGKPKKGKGGKSDEGKEEKPEGDESGSGDDSKDEDGEDAERNSGGETDGDPDSLEGEDEGEAGDDGEDSEDDEDGQGQGENGEDDGADADASGAPDAGEQGGDKLPALADVLSAGIARILSEIAADPTPLADAIVEVLANEINNAYADAPAREPRWETPPRAEPWPETRQIAAKVSTNFARPNVRSTGLGTGSIDRRAIARGESPHVAVLNVKKGRGKAQDVVICVDGSGSMLYSQKWELACRAAEVIFLALKREPENEVAIYIFNDILIRPVNPSSIDILHAGCPGGGTSGAWIEDIWREYPHHTVIIITDGEMYGIPQSPSTFDKRRTAAIGIGTDARTMESCSDRVQRAQRLEDLPGMMAGLIPQGVYA